MPYRKYGISWRHGGDVARERLAHQARRMFSPDIYLDTCSPGELAQYVLKRCCRYLSRSLRATPNKG